MPVLAAAPRSVHGYYEARPSDVGGGDGLCIVDVRGEAELLGPSGHIHGVRHVPLEQIVAEGLDVDPATPVVLVCEVGMRSVTAARSLVARGFVEVYSLVGGMRRWVMEERPVARTRTWT